MVNSSSAFPLVSIITPSYNQSAFLEAAIQSVLSQDYPNLEYIIIDGGSTDGSQDIIRAHASRLAYWVSEPDRGQADAINKGLSRARGEFVAWLNSDDVYLPGALRRAVSVLQSDPALGMVYGDLNSINPTGETFHTITYAQYDLADFLAFRIIGQPAVFMRRSVLERAGPLDPSYKYLLDHHLWIRISRIAAVKYVPEAWAAARIHPAAKNVAQASAFGEEVYRILEWAQAQLDLAAIIQANPRRVWAGAHRLNARYLLDGGAYAQSLRSYAKAFAAQPAYALHHWKRILYALFAALGLRHLLNRLIRPNLST